MKSNFKRVMSLILTVLMVITAIPLSGFATSGECADGHEFYGDFIYRDGKHARWCSVCGEAFGYMEDDQSYEGFQDCYSSMGATCKERAICDYCDKPYGELSEEHTGTRELDFDEKYIASVATCQQAAYYYYKCSECGEPMYDVDAIKVGSPDANAHKYSKAESNGDGTHKAKCEYDNCKAELLSVPCTGGTATCTEKAVCAYCKAAYGEPNGHDFTEKISDEAHLKTPATCTVKATYWYDCKNCDVSAKNVPTVADKVYSDGELKPHDFSAEKAGEDYIASLGNCQTNTIYYKSCTSCGQASEETFEGNVGEHKWGKYTYNNDATCVANGTKTANCTIEGCKSVDTIEAEGTKLEHNFAGTNVTDENKNLRTEATCTAKATYWKACTNEGCTAFASAETAPDAYFESGNFATHSYTEEVKTDEYNRTDATCIAKATRWYACAGCGKSAKDVENLEKAFYEYGEFASHNYKKEVHKDEYIAEGNVATCTTDAIYWYVCAQEGCGKSAKDADDSVPANKRYYTAEGTALGHKPVDIPAKEPTCTEKGSSAGKQCSVCKEYLVKPIERAANGHKEYVSVEKTEPTCTKVGHTEEKRCATCDQLLTAPSMTISALGHVDADGDEICDRAGCGTVVKEEDKCTCICHQSGIMGVLYFIVRLIWKLIGANPYCDCGIQHY